MLSGLPILTPIYAASGGARLGRKSLNLRRICPPAYPRSGTLGLGLAIRNQYPGQIEVHKSVLSTLRTRVLGSNSLLTTAFCELLTRPEGLTSRPHMNLHDHTSIHAPYSVINNTIHHYPPYPIRHPLREAVKRSKRHRDQGSHNGLGWLLQLNRQINRTVHTATWNASGRGDPPKCHPRTRQVVQNSLAAWPNDPMAGSVRLILGWAGTGKTTIAQTMAEYWANQGRLAASFFFSRSSEETSTTQWFSGAIAHQLLQTLFIPQGFTSDVSWDIIVRTLSTICPLSPSMVIVIDGLDECTDRDQQVELLQGILRCIDQLGSSIRFLISCRPERHLEKVFDDFGLEVRSQSTSL